MKIAEYVPLAVRTEKQLPDNERLVHGCMGLITECGEVVTELKRMHIYEKPLDNDRKKHICEEIGDMLWYSAILLDTLDTDLTMFANLPKLPFPDSANNIWSAPSLLFSVMIGRISYIVTAMHAGMYEDDSELRSALEDIVLSVSSLIGGMELIANHCDSSIETIMEENVAKLQIRFPNAYSNEAAEGRADKNGADARVS